MCMSNENINAIGKHLWRRLFNDTSVYCLHGIFFSIVKYENVIFLLYVRHPKSMFISQDSKSEKNKAEMFLLIVQ